VVKRELLRTVAIADEEVARKVPINTIILEFPAALNTQLGIWFEHRSIYLGERIGPRHLLRI
jgi:hypothetical protein